MMTRRGEWSTALACCAALVMALAFGCATTNSTGPSMQDGADVSVRGKIATLVEQHPIISPDPQFYFDWVRPDGATQQIIVVNRAGGRGPENTTRRLELRGRMDTVDLGGQPGTRDSYRNRVLYLSSWRYAD